MVGGLVATVHGDDGQEDACDLLFRDLADLLKESEHAK
jgi:hypothetical protein